MIELPDWAPKATGSYDRCVDPARTASLFAQIRARFKITRIADATRLDRSGVPTICAVVPQSPDLLSVYNGKGLTLEAARCSAVMEAFERQMGAAPPVQTFDLPVCELAEHLDLRALGLRESMWERVAAATWGSDLLTGERVAVPMALVQCPWFGDRLFKVTSTNGLASGNNLTEAIYHALCELIERHVWSLYHTRSNLIPQAFFGTDARDVGVAREVMFPTGNAPLDELYGRVSASGLRVRVLYLREGALPAVMVATTLEDTGSGPAQHMGFGSSLSPAHAATRALTEAVQSRIVDIQGAREDIVREDDPKTKLLDHARRTSSLPYGRWYFDAPARPIRLDAIEDRASDDLAADLRLVIETLRRSNAGPIAVVDLSPADLPLHVVRVVAPGLESFVVDGRIGAGMKKLLNPFRVTA